MVLKSISDEIVLVRTTRRFERVHKGFRFQANISVANSI